MIVFNFYFRSVGVGIYHLFKNVGFYSDDIIQHFWYPAIKNFYLPKIKINKTFAFLTYSVKFRGSSFQKTY